MTLSSSSVGLHVLASVCVCVGPNWSPVPSEVCTTEVTAENGVALELNPASRISR